MTNKYFIAIVPPQIILEEIESMKQDLLLKHNLKGALRSPAHITLHRPFEWKTEKEEALIETLKQFKKPDTFEIKLQNFNAFEPRVIFVDVVKNEALEELHNLLANYCKSKLKLFNEVEDMRGFHPHVTVAFRDLKKAKFYELWPAFQNQSYNTVFSCSQFCLLRLETKWEIIHSF